MKSWSIKNIWLDGKVKAKTKKDAFKIIEAMLLSGEFEFEVEEEQ